MLNKVILIGNVGKENPETRSFPSGEKYATFSLATSEFYKDKSGEKQTKTEWHNVAVYGANLVKLTENYVKAGTKLYIEGCIKYEKYKDKSGVEKHITKIVLNNFSSTLKILNSKNSDNESDSNNKVESVTAYDEIPF